MQVLTKFWILGNSLERIQQYLEIEQEPKATQNGIRMTPGMRNMGETMTTAMNLIKRNVEISTTNAKYWPIGPSTIDVEVSNNMMNQCT